MEHHHHENIVHFPLNGSARETTVVGTALQKAMEEAELNGNLVNLEREKDAK